MDDKINYPFVKAASALGVGVGVPWYASLEQLTQVVSFLSITAAFLYSLLLISDWWWKRFWRPLFERRGWIKKRHRRIITVEEYESTTSDLRQKDGKELT